MEIKNYTISDIERMSAADLASFAEDVETIRGHMVYYIDFGGAFGFSACVCADGRHIWQRGGSITTGDVATTRRRCKHEH